MSPKVVLTIYSKSTPGVWLMFAPEPLREKVFTQLSKIKWTLFHLHCRTRRGLLSKRLTDQTLNQISSILFVIHIMYDFFQFKLSFLTVIIILWLSEFNYLREQKSPLLVTKHLFLNQLKLLAIKLRFLFITRIWMLSTESSSLKNSNQFMMTCGI
jgi:hypothetical protein